MLKYKNIIDQMTDEQKLAFAADYKALQEPWVSNLGIPMIRQASLSELNQSLDGIVYPSFEALANTWDAGLIQDVSYAIAKRAKLQGFRLISTPNANIRSGNFSRGLSEDPYLAGTYAAASVAGINAAKAAVCLENFSLDETDVKNLDIEINERAIREYYVRPFNIALDGGNCDAVATSTSRLSGNYEDINNDLLRKILMREIAARRTVIEDNNYPLKAIEYASTANIILTGGDLSAFYEAFNTFRRLSEGLESGAVSAEELNAAVASGAALNTEMLDMLVDKVIDFAYRCNKGEGTEPEMPVDENTLCYKAAIKSTVLLKNKYRVLPLKPLTRVGVIGQAATVSTDARIAATADIISNLAASRSFTYVGAEEGYDLTQDVSDEMIEPAARLAADCDIVLFFLKGDQKAKKTSKLPANQLAALDAVIKQGVKVVAVVCGDGKYDMSFDDKCNAVICSSMDSSRSAEALIDIVMGVSSPSAKLANTLYDGTDEWFAKLERNKRKGKNKVGSFFGYRYYDAVGAGAKYPFGAGLTYANFELSSISNSDKGVTFKIANKSKAAAEAVLEVFVRKADSKLVRPNKELKSIVKVLVPAEEQKVVKIVFYKNDLSVFDKKSGTMKIEKGKYEVLVASSVSEVLLGTQMSVKGESVAPTGEKLNEFIGDEANIVRDDYRLRSGTKSTLSKEIKTVSLIATLFALLGDASIVLIALSMNLAPYWLFALFAAVLVNSPIATVIAYLIRTKKRNKLRDLQAKVLAREKADFWAMSELEKEIPLARMFMREIDEEIEVEQKKAEKKVAEKAVSKDDFWRYVDEKASLETITNGFISYAACKGMYISPLTAKKTFAALSASRLVIVKNEYPELAAEFVMLVSNYLGSDYYQDNAFDYGGTGDLMYAQSAFGNREKSMLYQAMLDAKRRPHEVKIATLVGVNTSKMNAYFSQAVRYLANPMRKNTFVIKNDSGTAETIEIPSNMWFFACPDLNLMDAPLPHFVGELASVIEIDARRQEPNGANASKYDVSFETLVYLAGKSKDKLEIDELQWKKIDRLEEYVATREQYSISNKASMQTESFVLNFIACGGEEKEAVDTAVASKLLPEIIFLLKDKPSESGSDLTEVIESYFGEENVPECRKVIKRYKSYGTL